MTNIIERIDKPIFPQLEVFIPCYGERREIETYLELCFIESFNFYFSKQDGK